MKRTHVVREIIIMLCCMWAHKSIRRRRGSVVVTLGGLFEGTDGCLASLIVTNVIKKCVVHSRNVWNQKE